MSRLVFVFFMVVVILAAVAPQPAAAQGYLQEVSVLLDGLPVHFDVQPVIKNGRTLVPFRAIGEALNVAVSWDGATRTVSATGGGVSISLQIGSVKAYRNNTPITLDVPPQILNGRTLVPLRFFSEAFGCTVLWDGAARTAKIASPPKKMTVIGFYALGGPQTSSWTNLFGKAYPEMGKGNTDLVSDLALGWYSLDREGNLLTESATGWRRPAGWEGVLDAAAAYGLSTEMVVHVTDGDGTLSMLLADDAAVQKAVAAIAGEADLYDGVNLDFEGLGFSESGEGLTTVRQRFTNFVSLLAGQLKNKGKTLTLSLHAPNSAYRGYDYEALGAVADRIVIMAYDYGARPEPVSLVIQAVEMAAAVPADKLVLGISVPSETPESILAKVGIAKRYNLNGIALWRLGLLSGEMWEALRSTVAVGNKESAGGGKSNRRETS
ncbi:MAG: stalk domain-containing protein [Thermoanaerobacteraceae bacterium]|nr:stalk domain-containing protein [Thermoanaerobacteraceae bacterium]